MTTIGATAMQDIHSSALKVVAAFRGDPVRKHLNRVQVECLDELENACRFMWELTHKKDDA